MCQAEDRVSKTVSLRWGEGVGAFITHQKSHLKCEPAERSTILSPVSHKVLHMLLKGTSKSVRLSARFKNYEELNFTIFAKNSYHMQKGCEHGSL